MAIKVTGGQVSLQGNARVKATVVEIDFPNANRVNGAVPAGAAGTLIIKNVPDHQNFQRRDALNYEDGNNNNAATLDVTGVVGPTKYSVTKR